MMRIQKKITALLLLLTIHTIHTANPVVVPYYPIRSQGLNTPRQWAGIAQQFLTKIDKKTHGILSAAFEYSRSFNADTITQCLFGNKKCPTLTISGSLVTDRNPTDLLADYFYLPSDFKSTINFKPSIDNIIVDVNFFIGLDEWVEGLYLAIYAPLVHSRWNLNMCETVELKGTNTFAPGYITPDTLQRNQLLTNFTSYAEGKGIGPYTQTVAGSDYTVSFQELNKARISQSDLNQTRLADFRVAIGYNFVQRDQLICAFQGLLTGPTGNKSEGEYLFEPIIGNGHHWELGGSLRLFGIPWYSQEMDKKIIISCDASFMHLFGANQRRTFDLKNKTFSRYMLAERLDSPIFNNLKGGGATPSAQFRNEYTPVANLTNTKVESSTTMQIEITAMLTFVSDYFSWDIGYNFWYQNCEHLKVRDAHILDNNSSWALKGDSFVFGFDRGATGAGPLAGAVPLSATQNKATIYSGLNFPDNSASEASLNPNIDNPLPATGDGTGGSASNPLSANLNSSLLNIQTSIQPIFISFGDLDVCDRNAQGRSQKLFTHFNYTWKNRELWVPFIGLGGEVEFGQNEKKSMCTSASCENCVLCSLSQWGIWLKVGMNF